MSRHVYFFGGEWSVIMFPSEVSSPFGGKPHLQTHPLTCPSVLFLPRVRQGLVLDMVPYHVGQHLLSNSVGMYGR